MPLIICFRIEMYGKYEPVKIEQGVVTIQDYDIAYSPGLILIFLVNISRKL